MVTIPTCKKCGQKVYSHYDPEFGLCYNCNIERQYEEEKREINNTSFPEGLISTWNARPAFLDRKNNYMYFRIPDTQRLFFDPNEQYQIVVYKRKSEV